MSLKTYVTGVKTVSVSDLPLTEHLGRVSILFIYELELKILSGIILRVDSRICIFECLEMLNTLSRC